MINVKNNGLNDFDKVFITVALWFAAMSLLVTALTLPMLPDNVAIFYKPVDIAEGYFSKYNNILIVLASLIPTVVLIVAASLKKRNKIKNNFISILLFCIMLSLCLGGVTVYGIYKQFEVSGSVRSLDYNTIIALISTMLLSALCSLFPMIFHSNTFKAGAAKRSPRTTYMCETLDKYWNFGAYGALIAGAACAFFYGGFAYIPLAVYIVYEFVLVIVGTNTTIKRKREAMLFDSLST